MVSLPPLVLLADCCAWGVMVFLCGPGKFFVLQRSSAASLEVAKGPGVPLKHVLTTQLLAVVVSTLVEGAVRHTTPVSGWLCWRIGPPLSLL